MIKTYSFEDGKYEIDRDTDTSLIKAVRRHGEKWPLTFVQIRHQNMIHAMLNHIDDLEASMAVKPADPISEPIQALIKEKVTAAMHTCYELDGFAMEMLDQYGFAEAPAVMQPDDDQGMLETVYIAKGQTIFNLMCVLGYKRTPPKSPMPEDFFTHHASWREALVLAIKNAGPATEDRDDGGYWKHELAAFDRAYSELASAPKAAAPALCEDEGCDHAGTKHVCKESRCADPDTHCNGACHGVRPDGSPIHMRGKTSASAKQKYYDQVQFRVWPDGTVQDFDETPHSHMSDDFQTVWAYTEEDAVKFANDPK